ncbi:MAG: hypothetical protein WCB19_05765 [Thermoplasmata archaeon]
MMENEHLSEVQGYASYADYLANNYANATAYYAACHASEPNYLAILTAATGESATNQNCRDGTVTHGENYTQYPSQNGTGSCSTGLCLNSIIEELNNHTLTAVTYAENLHTNASGNGGILATSDSAKYQCNQALNTTKGPKSEESDMYAYNHVSVLQLGYVVNQPHACWDGTPGVNGGLAFLNDAANFSAAINSTAFPNFAFFVPNLWDDGLEKVGTYTGAECGNSTIGTCTAYANTWLRNFLTPKLNDTSNGVYTSTGDYNLQHTAFVVVWDESDPQYTTGYAAGFNATTTAINQETPSHQYCIHAYHQYGGLYGSSNLDTVCGGAVYMSVSGPYSHGLGKFTAYQSDYSITAAIETLFGLPYLNNPGTSDVVFQNDLSMFGVTSNGY